jgi:multidrug efflux pump
MKELATRFPAGLEYAIGYDTTPFITESIMEVVKTLWEAVALVTLVVLLFLQNWRATLIPLVAVPVAIVGTFAAMAAMGFSLNTLSLFGLVLSWWTTRSWWWKTWSAGSRRGSPPVRRRRRPWPRSPVP